MISWFKNKNHPEFWKVYQKTFKNKTYNSFENTRFIVFDTETTGLNTSLSKILSIGAIAICSNKIDIADCFEVYLI